MKKLPYLLSIVVLAAYSGCKDDSTLDSPQSKLWIEIPAHFPPIVFSNAKNPITKEGFDLGKKLFYDPILSKDSTISCGSCHQIEAAFADKNKKLSSGVDGTLGIRNSPSLFNLQWHKAFMHDGGVNHMELIALAPIENPLEMKEKISDVLIKLNRSNAYKDAFSKVYNITSITDKYFYWAMTQFLSSLISADAKYDQMKKGTATYTENEQKGYALFIQHCNSCHSEPIFTNGSYQRNGRENIIDEGRKLITLLEEDKSKFKVPSLRNLSFTAPFMHDGAMQSLDEVIAHYSLRVRTDSTNVLLPKPLKFNDTEKEALLAFLTTLNDQKFVTNTSFLP